MMIKAVVFDIGGVLLDDMFRKIYDKIEELQGVPPKKTYLVRKEHWPAFMLGEITINEFFTRILKDLGCSTEHIDEIVRFTYDCLELKPGTMEVLDDLKKKGDLKLAILSNNSKEWSDKTIEKFHFKDYFDEFFLSCYLGEGKPFPEIYHSVITGLKLKPEEILFIDNKEDNIRGAKKEGMRGIVFKDSQQLRRELETLNLL